MANHIAIMKYLSELIPASSTLYQSDISPLFDFLVSRSKAAGKYWAKKAIRNKN